jgi:hypothetical protein
MTERLIGAGERYCLQDELGKIPDPMYNPKLILRPFAYKGK